MKFVDDFVDYCRDFTGCPEIFVRWAAILGLSAIAGNKHVLRRGDWDIRPNIWVLLLGNSSSYKSTGLATARRLLMEISPDSIGAQEYSHEKFIEDMSINPHRVLIYDEAESFFRMLDQSYNASMKSTIMTLWNRHPYKRTIKGKDGKGEEVLIKDAYLCWGGASTSVQIANQMRNGSSDLLSGFLPRFLIVSHFDKEETIEDPPPADRTKRGALLARLRSLANMGEREYVYTKEALEGKRLWLRQFAKRLDLADPLLGSFFKKLRDEHFHKIAMLSAFERDSSEMTIEDVGNAAQILWPIEKAWPALMSKLTEKEWDRDADRIETLIKREHQVDRSDILRSTRNIRAQKLTAILDGLVQDGKIQIKQEPSERRPRTIIVWCAD